MNPKYIHITRAFICGLLSLLLVACSGLHVESDYKPGSDFSGLKTWRWFDKTQVPKTGEVENTLLDQRVRTAVERSLAGKSYQKTTGEADFLVTYHFAVDKKLETRDVSFGLGYGSYGWGGWGGSINTGTQLREYEQGTLMIDILDSTGKELLWRGLAEKRLYDSQTPEEKEADINEAVAAILDKFPPQ